MHILKKQTAIFWASALLVWTYLWIRAIYNPLVFDEASSFFNYILSGVFLPGQAFWSANNHVLNSALAYLSYHAFGMDEWALRLPNVLCFPLFAYFSFKLISLLYSGGLRLVATLVLFTNHYLLEFFSYARGYGLMLAFISASLWFLYKVWQKPRWINHLKLGLSLSLAVLSNVSCLPLIGLLCATALLKIFKEKKGWAFLLLYLLPLSYALWFSWGLKSHHQLYYGANEGFIKNSLETLAQSAFGPYFSHWLFLGAGLILALSLILVLVQKQRSPSRIYALWFGACFFLITLFYPIGNWILNLKFPYDRALIYWLYFGLLSFFALVNALQSAGQKWNLLLLAWTLVFPFVALSQIRLTEATFESWAKEQILETEYDSIAAIKPRSISASYLLAPQWYYYQLKFGKSLPALQKTKMAQHQIMLNQRSSTGQSEPIYTDFGSIDYRAIKPLHLNSYQGNEGLTIIQFPADSIPDALELKVQIQIPKQAQKLSFVVQGFDEQGHSIYFEAFEAKHYLKPSIEWQEWRLFVVLEGLEMDVDSLRLICWNPKSEYFKLQNLRGEALNRIEK